MTSLRVLGLVKIPYQKTHHAPRKDYFFNSEMRARRTENKLMLLQNMRKRTRPGAVSRAIAHSRMWRRDGIHTALKFLCWSQMASELHFFNLKYEPLHAWGNLLGIATLDLSAEETLFGPGGYIGW